MFYCFSLSGGVEWSGVESMASLSRKLPLLVLSSISKPSLPIPSLHVSRIPSRHSHTHHHLAISNSVHRPPSSRAFPLPYYPYPYDGSEKRNLYRPVKVKSQLRYPLIPPDDHWGTFTALFAAGAFGLW